VQRLEVGVLHPVPPRELAHDELAVHEDGEALDAAVERQLEPGQKRLVLGDVVGRLADDVAQLLDELPLGGEQARGDPGRAGIASRPAVDVEVVTHVVTVRREHRPALHFVSTDETQGGPRRRRRLSTGDHRPDAALGAVHLDAHAVARQRVGERLGPPRQHGVLDHLVGRVDEPQAELAGMPRLVILDVAGHEHVRRRRGGLDQRGSRTGHAGDPAQLPLGPRADTHCGQMQSGGEIGGELRQHLGTVEVAHPSEPEARDLVLDRVDVEGGFLVRVRGDVSVDHGPPQPPREGDLDAKLSHRLVPAGLAGDRARPLAAVEGPHTGRGERAVLVGADAPAADGEHGGAHGRHVVLRDEADQLAPVDGGRGERTDVLEPQHGGEHVAEPSAGLVEVGVRHEHGGVVARRTQGQRAGDGAVGQALERREQQRVMREDERAPLTTRR